MYSKQHIHFNNCYSASTDVLCVILVSHKKCGMNANVHLYAEEHIYMVMEHFLCKYDRKSPVALVPVLPVTCYGASFSAPLVAPADK